MPFTLAHPAVVLPLRRTALVFSALIVGSMAPDFPYFLTLSDNIRWGHSLPGVFLFCLPVGWLVLWLYHAVVKRPLAALAPESLRVRIAPADLQFRFAPLSRFLLIVVSLLIGIFAHILWDGFTHDHGYFVKHWSWLSMPVFTYRTMPLWRALQHVCSVLGMLAVMVAAVWWWWQKPVVSNPVPAEWSPARRWTLLGIGFLFASMTGLSVAIAAEGRHHWKWLMVKAVIVAISTACAEILLFSLAWQATHRAKEKPQERVVETLNVPAER